MLQFLDTDLSKLFRIEMSFFAPPCLELFWILANWLRAKENFSLVLLYSSQRLKKWTHLKTSQSMIFPLLRPHLSILTAFCDISTRSASFSNFTSDDVKDYGVSLWYLIREVQKRYVWWFSLTQIDGISDLLCRHGSSNSIFRDCTMNSLFHCYSFRACANFTFKREAQ